MPRVLLATALDPDAANTAKFALAIARAFGEPLTVYHAFGRPSPSLSGPPDVERRAQVERLMRELVAQAAAGGDLSAVDITYTVSVYYAGDGILAELDRGDYDLLVLGLRDGADAFTTVSERMLQEAECDVLAVPPGATFQGVDQVVFATDLDDADAVALEKLQRWREHLVAELIVVNVYDSDAGRARAEKRLGQWRRRYEGRRHTTFEAVAGDFEEDILTLVKRRGGEMLAVQSNPGGFFRRLFGGGHTRELAQHVVDIPLLVIRGER